MTTTVIEAVYQEGVFKPINAISLPENARVTVLVSPRDTADQQGAEQQTLFGAFPELAAISDDDIAWAKGLWEHSLDKQMRILGGDE